MKDKKTTLTWSNMANNLMTDKLNKWRNLDWDKLTDYEKQVVKGAYMRIEKAFENAEPSVEMVFDAYARRTGKVGNINE